MPSGQETDWAYSKTILVFGTHTGQTNTGNEKQNIASCCRGKVKTLLYQM